MGEETAKVELMSGSKKRGSGQGSKGGAGRCRGQNLHRERGKRAGLSLGSRKKSKAKREGGRENCKKKNRCRGRKAGIRSLNGGSCRAFLKRSKILNSSKCLNHYPSPVYYL